MPMMKMANEGKNEKIQFLIGMIEEQDFLFKEQDARSNMELN